MSTFSTISSSSSYISSSPCSPGLHSSPSTYSISTPPDSFRQYSSALKAKMVAGMKSAMADMVDESREAERQFDTEFGYDDEDPIERHVRMFLTPRKPKHPKVNEGLGIRMDMPVDMSMEVEINPGGQLLVETEDRPRHGSIDEDQKAFQPGLIQFHRTHSHSSRASIPSFSRTDSSLASGCGSGNGPSTPFIDNGMGTPGSDWSEASFEAVKSEDYVSLYGTYSSSSSSSSTSIPDRSSISSTITSLSTSTVKPTQRPSLARPRPRQHQQVAPYPGSIEMRARERETSGGDPGKLLPGTPIDEIMEPDWMQGRTISETMIAQAGLRCQRGRANRR